MKDLNFYRAGILLSGVSGTVSLVFKPMGAMAGKSLPFRGQRKRQDSDASGLSSFVFEQSGATTVEFIALLATMLSVTITSTTLVGNASVSLGAATAQTIAEADPAASDGDRSGNSRKLLGGSANSGLEADSDRGAEDITQGNGARKSGDSLLASNDSGENGIANRNRDNGARNDPSDTGSLSDGDGGSANDVASNGTGNKDGSGNGGNNGGGSESLVNPAEAEKGGGGSKDGYDSAEGAIAGALNATSKSRRGAGGNSFQFSSTVSNKISVDIAGNFGLSGGAGSFSEEHERLGTCRKPAVMPELFDAAENA